MAGEARARAQKLGLATDEDVAATVDAVTGATWKARNAIMAGLFRADLAAHGDALPAFRPAGSPCREPGERR